MVIRTSLQSIRVMGRAAQGVRIVKLHPGDSVTDVVRVSELENGNGNGNDNGNNEGNSVSDNSCDVKE